MLPMESQVHNLNRKSDQITLKILLEN